MTLVLDTNVFISGLRGRAAPAQLFTFAREGAVTFATSPLLLDEIQRVLTYPKVQALLRQTQQQIDDRLADFRQMAYLVEGNISITAIQTDPTDNAVLACAVEAQADLIVSGDHAHVLPLKIFQGIPIVTPHEAVHIIQRLQNDEQAA
jgi:uncharacterized protein